MLKNKINFDLINKSIKKLCLDLVNWVKNYNYSNLNVRKKLLSSILYISFLLISLNIFPTAANLFSSLIPDEKDDLVKSLNEELLKEKFKKQEIEITNQGLMRENLLLKQKPFIENLTNTGNESPNYVSYVVLGLLGTGTCVFLLHLFGIVSVPAIQYSIEKMVELANINNLTCHSQSQAILDHIHKNSTKLAENQNTELNKLEEILRIIRNIALGAKIFRFNVDSPDDSNDDNSASSDLSDSDNFFDAASSNENPTINSDSDSMPGLIIPDWENNPLLQLS